MLGNLKIDFRTSRDSLRVSIRVSLCCEAGGFGEREVEGVKGSLGTDGVSVGFLPKSLDFVRWRLGVDFACRNLGREGNLFNGGLAVVN